MGGERPERYAVYGTTAGGGGGELVGAYFGKAEFGEGKFWYNILDTMKKCGTIFQKVGTLGGEPGTSSSTA